MTDFLEFDQYIRQGEPMEQERAAIWRTAIGLQAVDGLQTSDYLKQTAKKHIEGEIDIDEARQLIKTYYQSKSTREAIDDDQHEADKVSANITKILSSSSLDFSAKGFLALHRRIFEGVFKHAGELRKYDITKKEWVLDTDTVNYLNWEDLYRALEFDIEQERNFSYKNLPLEQQVLHIAQFVSGLWQIHPFGEGNTRTTAVFTILYLRHIGFSVENDLFANHSWYFRNALVRANYKNAVKGIDYSPIYLERFFRNLLMGEQWDLRNRYLHISASAEWKEQSCLGKKAGDVTQNVTQNVTQKLTIRQQNVLRLIQADKTISAATMAATLGVTVRSIRRDIEAIREHHNLLWIGPTKGGHWEINN
ncbi:MAG: Fic family protein [Paludibacteraceae bacterium]|nr:Fic family protein [Paludibacteraceae bacterium]